MRPIFHAGGALPSDHTTYVERQADRDALRAALNGDYLHIIAPRQIGKTSLLKRLAAKLSEMGWRCAYVDLSTLMDFSKPTWYAELGRTLAPSLTPGQIPQLANQVDLRRHLLDQALPWHNSQPRIALFFDEVEGASKAHDFNGTPFSDTFFMTLRNLYIQRDTYNGTIVVALAGAVNPSDLVKDPDISPFNVGQEIGLDDFTSTETRALTEHLAKLGMSMEESVHKAIHDWTNGHPYLTQRICVELETTTRNSGLTAITSDNVTHIVEQVILNPTNPLQRDKNLRHVAKMLSVLSAPAAQLWSRLQSGDSLSVTEISDFAYLELYLTGAVKTSTGRIVIRNQIYENAFMQKPHPGMATAVDGKPRSSITGKAIRVFISSTWEDLQPEREAVEKALHRMRDTAFAGMEYFGSRPETPREVSLNEVDRSDVYIGIFAHRYGSGITEAEYRRAREQDIPCLIYFKDDSVPVPPAQIDREAEKSAKLEALKRELKAHHTISFFKNPDELAAKVATDLHNLIASLPSESSASHNVVASGDRSVAIGGNVSGSTIITGDQKDQPRSRPSDKPSKYVINIEHAEGIAIGDQAQVIQQFGDRPVSPGQVTRAPSRDQRCSDLAKNIQETLDLIKQYEDQRRLASDPKEKQRAEREIADLRTQLATYEAEYDKLGCTKK
jgi:hypothetical protein